MSSNKIALLLVVLLSVFLSCKKTETYEMTSLLTGPIKGKVYGDDMKGKSDILVELNGPQKATAKTDNNGLYYFNDIKTGNYTATYSYPGYGVWKTTFFHLGGTDTTYVNGNYLYKVSTAKILSVVKDDTDSTKYLVTSDSSGSFDIIIFCSYDQNVSPENSIYMLTSSANLFDTWFLYHFEKGRKVYLYVTSATSTNSYWDGNLKRRIFPFANQTGGFTISINN